MDDDRGTKIREARIAKQMTQGELAQAVGVSPRVISRWETGQVGPNDERLAMLRIVLEADL